MPIVGINKVCFVGAGTMGCANSLVASLAGYKVHLFDSDDATLGRVADTQRGFADHMIGKQLCDAKQAAEALARIELTSSIEAATLDADLASESVYEQLNIKRELHAKLDSLLPADAILTTNTSTLLVSDIEQAVTRHSLFAALHSHLGSPLYDIVGGSQTSEITVETLKQYVLSLGGYPLVLRKEHPGYVLNALLASVLNMAMLLVMDGESSAETVDADWMVQTGAEIGPFGLIDLFGIDIIADSSEQRPASEFVNRNKTQIDGILSPFRQRKALGVKTGKGFYDYPEPAFHDKNFCTETAPDCTHYTALKTTLIAHAVHLVMLDIATPQDIDRAWMLSIGVAKGPFAILDEVGIEAFLDHMARQVDKRRIDPTIATHTKAFLQKRCSPMVPDKRFYSYPNPEFMQAGFLNTNFK